MMKIELEPSGERVMENMYKRSLGAYTIYMMHIASYRFVEKICTGRRVLDYGCGSGYGAKLISKIADEVVGVDVSPEAIQYAGDNYRNDNLSFHQIDPGSQLPFPDGHFDVILSFQVIEHVSDDDSYLREARRLLGQGGILVTITPDRQHRLLAGQKPWNRWHLREYSQEMLVTLISRHFAIRRNLKMGAEWGVAATEMVRYRKTKWLCLPVTLPFIPESVRRFSLDLIHRITGMLKSPSNALHKEYGFDESAFIISDKPPNPMNLIIVAQAEDASQAL